MTNEEVSEVLDTLLGLPCENEVVEFKTADTTFHFEKIGKYFSALSNEANLKGVACLACFRRQK